MSNEFHVKRLDYIVITTVDAPTHIAFYVRYLVFVTEMQGAVGAFFGRSQNPAHLLGHELSPKAGRVQSDSADICFEVEGSIAACRKMFTKNDIAPEIGIVVRHGARSEMRSVYVRDPDGNLVDLCSYE